MSAIHIAVLAFAVFAAVIDLRERRIPNWLTLGATAAGLAFHLWTSGLSGLLFSAGGWVTGVAIFFLPFALGGLGAGDVKLVAALGAWLGWQDTVWLGLYTGAAGGLLAIVVSLASGYMQQAFSNIWLLLMHWRVAGLRPLPEMTIHHGSGPKLAYGVAILAGTMVTVWMH
jgi:prepilin peptidase CpaA